MNMYMRNNLQKTIFNIMDHTKAILFYFLLADYAKATCI